MKSRDLLVPPPPRFFGPLIYVSSSPLIYRELSADPSTLELRARRVSLER